jgi:hypothetical protein
MLENVVKNAKDLVIMTMTVPMDWNASIGLVTRQFQDAQEKQVTLMFMERTSATMLHFQK